MIQHRDGANFSGEGDLPTSANSAGPSARPVGMALHELFLDYEYYKAQSARMRFADDPLGYRRTIRSAGVAFVHYFIGVLDCWITGFGLNRDSARSVVARLKQVRFEIRRRAGPDRVLNLESLRWVRARLGHLDPVGTELMVADQATADGLLQDMEALLTWLKVASYWLNARLDDRPLNPINSGAIEARDLLGAAEDIFLELDAREALDAPAAKR